MFFFQANADLENVGAKGVSPNDQTAKPDLPPTRTEQRIAECNALADYINKNEVNEKKALGDRYLS